MSQGETKTPVEEVVQRVAGQSGDQPEVQVPSDDVDAQALASAQAELKAEQDAAKAQEAPQVADPAAPKAEEPKKDQPKAGEGDKPKHIPGMVPLSVLQKVAGQRNEAERKIAFLEGKLSVSAPTNPAAEAPKLTPEQRIADVRKQAKDLAAQVNKGALDFEEYEDKRQGLMDQELAIREESRKPAEAKPAPTEPSQDLYRESKLDEIETAHPYVKELEGPEFQANWDFLGTEAMKQLVKEGKLPAPKPNQKLTPAQDLSFRNRMAELTDEYGPIWTGKQIAIPGKVQAQPKGQPPAKTAEARAEKLKLQTEMPPDVSTLGTTGPSGPDLSDAAIEAMGEEDIIKRVPKSTRDRMLGRVPS